MTDGLASPTLLRVGLTVVLVGAASLAYSVVLYSTGETCGAGATLLPCGLAFWKSAAIVSLFVGAAVTGGSLLWRRA